MNFEIDEKIKNKLINENIRLEYTSLLNITNQFIFRQENNDYVIIVPRKSSFSHIECIWSLAHEYGHYLIRINKEIDEFSMEQLEIEKLSWQKGKIFLKELDLPTNEKMDTYDAFAERCLDTYKLAINNSKDKIKIIKESGNKKTSHHLLVNFNEICKGTSTLVIGIIIGYALLMAFGKEMVLYPIFIVAITMNFITKMLQHLLEYR